MKRTFQITDKKLLDVKMSVGEDDEDDSKYSSHKRPVDSKSRTPVLDSFSKDLTKLAEENKLDPIVGREKEIERVSQILSRRKKNNPILIGEAGVGKSAVAEGLAQRIVQRKVSRTLFGKRVVTLDLASMVAGTKYRGQFEERIKALMAEIEKDPNIILFIDEIHTIVGAGGASGSLDASNMFKPALARGEIQIIGATTLDEYRKHIEKDAALERRFQKVIIEPSSSEETLEIINNIKDKYESHHGVVYTEDALKACVDLTVRFMSDRFLPDKAIDALDEAGSRAHISNVNVPKEILDLENKIQEAKEQKVLVIKGQKYEEAAKLRDVEKNLQSALEQNRVRWEEEQKENKTPVTEEMVAEVVSMMTGIPLQKVGLKENEKLSKMPQEIMSKVIGQDDAVRKITKAIQRSRMGMKDPNRPQIVALCIGSSGVGKTELAKQVAKYMFESENALLRLDMSEFMEKIAITKIIGASQGYVGYDDSTFLDRIRRTPYCVLLLDEIEKAHPEVFNLFLQAFDEGHMSDSHGRKVSFKNCVILMTSNVGTKKLSEFGTGVGFQTKAKSENRDSDMQSVLEDELKKKFPPEFINRIDEVIYFNDLKKEDIQKIIHLELDKSVQRLRGNGFESEVSQDMIDHLIKVGYDPKFGARPLKRAIQRWIDDPVTDVLLEGPDKDVVFQISYDETSNKTKIDLKKPFKAKRVKKSDS